MSATDSQLCDFKKQQKNGPGTITLNSGVPIGIQTATKTVGRNGLVLLEDPNYVEEIAHFDRERIPERVIHAKGAGAFGYFEVTHDITKYSAAKVFEKVGKKTPVAVRFSFVSGESGSADTTRDPRGFAIKFYTEDGNWDLVANNTPIFFIRDPILFPSFIHSQKRNPQTHLKDANMFWDFITLRPETTHQTMILFSDRGIPDGYRFMHGYGSHTFKLINSKGEPVYCKFHIKSAQGIKNLDPKLAQKLAGSDPDYSIRDLFNSIASGDFPSWDFFIQVMTLEQAEEYMWNPFDVTKVWLHSDFPLIPVGRLVLNKNPVNYFAEVEQMAFSPSNFVPGIEASPDRMLQGRLFSYPDAHRYRLGTNYLQIPVNCPYKVQVKNYQRDGASCYTDNQGGAPNYYPNSFGGPEPAKQVRDLQPPYRVSGDVYRYDTGDEDNFSQAKLLWDNVLDDGGRRRLADNIAEHAAHAKEFVQERIINLFSQVSADFGGMLKEGFLLRRTAKIHVRSSFK